ncbi:hypothetical protein LCGC14_1442060, partial [marine sediment metagenome]
FRADTGAFDRNIKKSRSHMTRFGKDTRVMSKQLLALAGVGGGLYAIKRGFNAITKAASDAEETQAKFNTVFKQLSDQANRWAESFGVSVGRSEESVKSWMARLQDTFVPLGLARVEAMNLAKSLVTLAVDVASFNNAVDADVIRDFTSALVGNHETVRKFGIMISEVAIREEALRQGIEKNYRSLTELEKVQLRYNIILQSTKDAQGDALRTADSYANTIKRLSSVWTNLKKTMGEKILPLATDFFRGLTMIIEDTSEASDKLKKSLDNLRDAPKSLFPLTVPPPRIFTGLDFEDLSKERMRVGELPPPKPPSLSGEDLIRQRVIARGREQITQMEKMIKLRAEQDEMMEDHIIKITEQEGGYQQMRERMARQAIETEIAASTKRFEEAQRVQEKVGENQKRIYSDIARGMAYEWSSAFDQMIFEGKKFAETMTDLLRGILRMITQIVMYETVAKPIAAGMMGINASTLHSGGIVGQTGATRRVPAMAFAGAPRLHGGLAGDEYPAILQRGEQVIPRGGGGMAPTIIVNNNTGQKMRQEGETMFDGKQWVIRIVTDDIQQGGPLRKMVQGLR